MSRNRPALHALVVAPALLAALALGGSALAQEAWDAVYVAGVKSGYIHLRVEPLNHKGRDLVRVRYDLELKFKRDKDPLTLQHQWGTIELPSGEVLRLDTRTLVSQQELRTTGEVSNNQMVLETSAGGQKQQQVIPWGPDVRGPYGAELSMSREIIKPGEHRSVKTFIPELNKVCYTVLDARDKESVALGGGQVQNLLRVESKVTHLDGKPIPGMNTTFWVDEGGQILKSFTDAMGGMETYRTTKEAAIAPGAGKLDVLHATIIRVPRKIQQPENTRDVVYRVHIRDGDPLKVFPTDPRQSLKRGSDEHTAIIEVRASGPNSGKPGPEHVDAAFLRPNVMINSDDPEVVALAHKAVGSQQDPWQKAVAVEKWVFNNMRTKDFTVGFASAREVARNLEGDCTEHSVLTAAMCRAVGLPARVATGLIYAAPLGGFGFHMWTEVYVNRRWVALDAAFDQSEVDAVHIKLADSSLDGVSPFETFQNVASVANKTTLEPIEIR